MSKIRIYVLPKGYIDVICDSVTMAPVLGGSQAVINGGNRDGEIIKNVRGAKLLERNCCEQRIERVELL